MGTVILKWNPKISNYRMCDFERDIKMMKEVVICYDWDFGHLGMVLNDEDAVKWRDLFRNYMMKKAPFKGDDCVLHLPLFMVKDEEMLTYIEALRNNHKM